MKIGAGETVALVGMSGGGKSTLSDLIPRFYDPEQGVMLIDGVNAKRFSLRSLRAEIGLVSQHTFLFNDTIRANIAYGGGSGDFAAIVAAAKAANAHDFITRLPNGYDTLVGELGVRAFGRRAATPCDRAGAAQECSGPDPRRTDLEPRFRG